MIRQIIIIDQEKCNGCGLCVTACHEGALAMSNGKATLTRDDYCDGLGNCLPVCPTGAITFEEREALPYDEAAVENNIQQAQLPPLPCGCPGSHAKVIPRHSAPAMPVTNTSDAASELRQWPVQIKLVPVNATYFNGTNLLIAADCAAYAYAAFHNEFMKDRVTIIGCPKLDNEDYSQKLTAMIAGNDIQSVTVVRMDVPCCGGIESAARVALQKSGKTIPWQITTITTAGRVL